MREKTVSVNGTVYDSRTGMPLRVERGNDTPTRHHAGSVHTQLQKSRTLNRRYVRLDSAAHAATHTSAASPESSHTVSVHTKRSVPVSSTKSEHVTRFASSSVPAHKPAKAKTMDIAPAKHHIVQRVEARTAATQSEQRVLKPSHIIKQEAIHNATESMKPKHTKKDVKPNHRSRLRRLASVGTASLAILVLGAYLTYLNMPALSTRVAATQAGINASYPSYQPTGYSLSGPVAYQQGSVTMKFAANAAPTQYTLSQTHSDWDSTAVLDNYVTPQAGKDYVTTTTGGLTIYTYDDNAVWVNGGILYTISGNASLSSDQVQRIATSL